MIVYFSITLVKKNFFRLFVCSFSFFLSLSLAALTDETHSLHPPLQHMYEQLASRSLTPRDEVS